MAMAIRRVFLAWLNDDDSRIDGYVELLEESPTHIKFKRGFEIITLPISRILKLKEVENGN